VDEPELTYAIVGAGSAARTHLRDITARPGVRLVGIADPADPGQWQIDADQAGVPRFPDAAALFAAMKPQLVSICTPPKFHHHVAQLAFACGAHVACEKPLAVTLEEALAMEAARVRAQALGAVNFSCRNVPAFRLARQMVEDGEVGRIRRVTASYLQSYLGTPDSRWSWRDDIDIAGFGSLGDLGAHVIDAVRFVVNAEFLRVDAVLQRLQAEKKTVTGERRAITTDSNAMFLAELTGDVFATVETSQVASGYANFFRLEVSGDRGTLIVNREQPDTIGLLPASRQRPTTAVRARRIGPGAIRAPGPASPAGIVDAIRGRNVAIPTFHDGIAVQRVLAALTASAGRRGWVDVE
jgi:predicted dehydrogenase